jgi:hypothetical protein
VHHPLAARTLAYLAIAAESIVVASRRISSNDAHASGRGGRREQSDCGFDRRCVPPAARARFLPRAISADTGTVDTSFTAWIARHPLPRSQVR